MGCIASCDEISAQQPKFQNWGCPADLLTNQAVLDPKVHGHTSRAPPVGIEPTSPPTKVVALPTKPQIQVSNSYISVETIMDWMVSLIPIGETVSHVSLQKDCWHGATNLSCCGDQESRRQLRCQLRKSNNIQHLKLQSRSYIFAT